MTQAWKPAPSHTSPDHSPPLLIPALLTKEEGWQQSGTSTGPANLGLQVIPLS